MAQEAGPTGRIVTRITVSYRLPDDPAEYQMTVEHTDGGQDVDAITWNGALMRKLAYREGGECREPKKVPGRGEWKVTSSGPRNERTTSELAGAAEMGASAAMHPDCVWVHFNSCQWADYCPDT